MMTGFHKYTIFVVLVLVDLGFAHLFKLFGGPLSFHHANDVHRLGWTYSGREDLYTPNFGNFRDKLKVRAAEKLQLLISKEGGL